MLMLKTPYLGDWSPGDTIDLYFNTVGHTSDAPITLAGTPAVSVYKDGGTTEGTAGVSLAVDFDARTGLHHVAINTAADAAFYAAGSDFAVVITAGTVDGVSVVGETVGSFSLQNRSQGAATIATMGSMVRYRPLGYGRVTSLSAAAGLPTISGSIPNADVAVIRAETQAVRYRDDGTDPTAAIGTPLSAGQEFVYTGNMSAIKFIEQTASATLHVNYYKNAG